MKTRQNFTVFLLLLPFFWSAPIDAQHIRQADTARVVFFVH